MKTPVKMASNQQRQVSDGRALQRTQLARKNKEELVDMILASGEDGTALANINKRMDDVVKAVDALKDTITAQNTMVNKNYEDLKAQVDKQAEIIAKQQQYLEYLDRKEREGNVVILGVPDEQESLDGAVTDEEKLNKIWTAVGMGGGVAGTHRRLGGGGLSQASGGTLPHLPRPRPILLMLADKNQRTTILNNANRLKTSGDNFSRIYIKKDVHPSVRKEWRRLREVETAEKAKPENVGCVVRLDPRERKVYKDNTVIDTWNAQFF